jgi:hypothetical protein
MSKVLEMVFRNANGKESAISLPEPKEDLTLAQVRPVMQGLVDKKIFTSKGGDLVQVVEARIRSKDVTVMS